jgi:hypothetical protein
MHGMKTSKTNCSEVSSKGYAGTWQKTIFWFFYLGIIIE